MLDYAESPLWANDEEARETYGYNIDLTELGLRSNTITRTRTIMRLYQKRLNPVYPAFPSLWSGRMHLFFQLFVKQVYSEIVEDLSDKYEIENAAHHLMNEPIAIEEFDKKLRAFLQAPAKYADENGISYSTKEKLKTELQEAYQKWEKEELKWLSF